MRVHAIVLLAALSMAAVSTPAEADRRGPPGFPGGGAFPGPDMMMERMADHLDLDDTQRAQVQNIMEAARPEFEALREQWRANREALASLDTADPGYSVQLNDIALSNGQLATDGTLLFSRVRSEIHAVLTDEQRDKLARSKERMHKAFERRAESS